MNRILLEKPALSLSLSDFRADHIRRVLKLGVGDSFDIGVVNAFNAKAVITAIDSDALSFTISEESDPGPLAPVDLLIPQVRPICMKRILRDCTMLGVRTIAVCSCDTSERSYAQSGLWLTGEYLKYLLDGAMQAADCAMGELVFFDSIDKAACALGNGKAKLILDNRCASRPLSQMSFTSGQQVCMALGPERGWSDRERGILQAYGYVPCLLGSRILRTETALNVGLGVLYARMGLI